MWHFYNDHSVSDRSNTGCSLNIVFFLEILWFFWTLPVLLQRWCSTCHLVVHAWGPVYTPREARVRKIFWIFRNNTIFNEHPVPTNINTESKTFITPNARGPGRNVGRVVEKLLFYKVFRLISRFWLWRGRDNGGSINPLGRPGQGEPSLPQ